MNRDIVSLVAARLREEKGGLSDRWHGSGANENTSGISTRFLAVDELLPIPIATMIYEAFPIADPRWHVRSSFRERKRTLTAVRQLDPVIQQVTAAFHDPAIVELVGELTGIADLEADPSLYAAGISMMSNGDFLNPHIDNSHDGRKERYRRLNLLYYVTPGWDSTWGGSLELWDRDVKNCVAIPATFNRLVIMETNRTSWHSVDAVKSDSLNRCCLSNYYFSVASPTGERYQHVTSFLGRPGQWARRAFGRFDNASRQLAATTLGIGRGRKRLNDV